MVMFVSYVKMLSSILNFLMVLSTIYGAGDLRTPELRISPRTVHKGGEAILTCLYEAGFSVYTVKWYKGPSEFYRYSALEPQNSRIIPISAVQVDMSRSNASQVVLLGVSAATAGNYSCEVIKNDPFFTTASASATLNVIAGGLRALELRISPPVVQRGADVTLQCIYELHDAPLYSVKWYRGRHEFYRYCPSELPNTKIFPFARINVDLARSNETQVILTRVSFGLSGNFSCEVTADAPSFSTSIVSNQLEVVVLPAWPPRVLTERVNYSPGDVLHANCSSPPSRPQPVLAFYIDNVQIRPGQLRVQHAGEGMTSSELSIAVQLLPAHYERGSPVLRCEVALVVASRTVYKEATQVVLHPANGDPKIERVTSPGSAAAYSTSAAFLLVTILSCFFRQILF